MALHADMFFVQSEARERASLSFSQECICGHNHLNLFINSYSSGITTGMVGQNIWTQRSAGTNLICKLNVCLG